MELSVKRRGPPSGADRASRWVVFPVLKRQATIRQDEAASTMTLNQLSDLTRSVLAETDDELFGVGPNLPLGSFRSVAPRIFSAPDLRTMLIWMDSFGSTEDLQRSRPAHDADLDGLSDLGAHPSASHRGRARWRHARANSRRPPAGRSRAPRGRRVDRLHHGPIGWAIGPSRAPRIPGNALRGT
jgi:hypothetical protein